MTWVPASSHGADFSQGGTMLGELFIAPSSLTEMLNASAFGLPGSFVIAQGGQGAITAGDDSQPALVVQSAAGQTNPIVRARDSNGTVRLEVEPGGNVLVPGIPAADPHVVGAIYSVAGTLHVSAG